MASAIYCDERKYREDVDDYSEMLPGKQWTPWIELIKPEITEAEEEDGWEEKRENRYTTLYINLAELKEFVESVVGENGIYELRLKKEEETKKTCVVYIGSSCAENGLYARLSQYATKKSNKFLLIQAALSAGATIEARACPYKLCETARACENEILAKFDYLWNIRSNQTPRKREASVTALYRMTPAVFSTIEVT